MTIFKEKETAKQIARRANATMKCKREGEKKRKRESQEKISLENDDIF